MTRLTASEQIAELTEERDAERDRVRRLAMGEAEAMALAMSHEGHIAKLEAEVARLKAELLKEADKHFAGARAVLEDALGEGERRAVICETCHGTGLVHAYSATDTCSDCGNDGCGPGVRWET